MPVLLQSIMISVITPSFRSGDWLPLCIASVADQSVEHEHIVQDAGSDDGTLDWLPSDKRVKLFVESDRGMYDAVNRGLQRATGHILGYLNCDEQYLPGTLSRISEWFADHPKTDVLFGDAIVVDGQGDYICSRTALTPTKMHSLISGNLSFLTAATFFRRSVMERGIMFNSGAKAIGDGDWAISLLRHGVKMGVFRAYLAVFAETSGNLATTPLARREFDQRAASAPGWARMFRSLILAKYRIRKAFAGAYSLKPLFYEIYTKDSPSKRRKFVVEEPSQRWKGR